MAFGRKFISSLVDDENKVDAIIDAHAEVVDALKAEIEKYKSDAEKLPQIQKELDEARKGAGDEYKEKYDALKQEYDDYKASISEQKTYASKKAAYSALLKEVGISEKRIDGVVKYDADIIKGIELDNDGKIKNADDLKEKAKKEWDSFIVSSETHGSNTATPPTGTGKVYKTKEEIMAIEDDVERQEAIAQNLDMFK